jgi:hypothetical protein
MISRGNRTVYTHRIAWEIAHGKAPPAHLEVCHTCDNPPCVNPAHLFLGTHSDNALDASRKGRLNNAHARKTHCAHGHSFAGENLRVDRHGYRACRACEREKARRRKAAAAPLEEARNG